MKACKILWLICFITVLYLSNYAVFARVIHVPSECSTIQHGINCATHGDTVIVAPGTYHERIQMKGKNIKLTSTAPTSPSIVTSTVIDAQSQGTVITFSGGEDRKCVVSGFTIKNGLSDYGGGVWGGDCDATISYNIISHNTARECGGGIHSFEGAINNNRIKNNYAGALGGGMCFCSSIVYNNLISDNSANAGGGIFGFDGLLYNNLIFHNMASTRGGGLGQCHATIANCSILYNHAERYGATDSSCRPSFLVNSIMWGNVSADGGKMYSVRPFYCCVQDWEGEGIGNISSDPQFVSLAQRDFHLKQNSPCIDTGNTFYLLLDKIQDLDGLCRLSGLSVDMGCYEYGSRVDSDADLVDDFLEGFLYTDPENPDTDDDGLIDGVEVIRYTNPLVYDTPPGIAVREGYSSIQESIFKAFPLETITILPGTYYENIHMLGKNVTIQSSNPLSESIVETTVIDGNQNFVCVYFLGNENEDCIIQGLTIRNGRGSLGGGIAAMSSSAGIFYNNICDNYCGWGGGIYGGYGEIQHNVIQNNSARGSGGGIGKSGALISDNIISNNEVGFNGGGLAECYGTVQNNIISYNTAEMSGGGIYKAYRKVINNIIKYNAAYEYGGGCCICWGDMEKNVIVHNGATYDGGGIANSSSLISNNVISHNGSFFGVGGVYRCEDLINNTIYNNRSINYNGGLYQCFGTIENCIIWGNSGKRERQLVECSTPFYCCIQDCNSGGSGNISLDPQLKDPASNDFHLTATSPCIDAGYDYKVPDSDFENDPRPIDIPGIDNNGEIADYDIGADEFIPPTPTPIPTETPLPTVTPTPTPTPIPVAYYGFEGDAEGWSFAGEVPPYECPEGFYLDGALVLDACGSCECFSSWVSPAIPIEASRVYRARWRAGSNVSDPDTCVQFRLRLNQTASHQGWSRTVVSSHEQAPWSGEPKWYEIILNPSLYDAGDNEVRAAFDIVSFDVHDASYSWVYLDEMVMDNVDVTTGTTIADYTFTPDTEGWKYAGAIAPFDEPLHESGEGSLGLNPGGSDNAFSYWHSPDVGIEDGTIYRARFEVSSSVSDPDDTVQFRCRVNQRGSWQAWDRGVNSNLQHAPSATESKPSDVFFTPNVTAPDDAAAQFSFDIMSFDPADDTLSWVYLESVMLEEITLQP